MDESVNYSIVMERLHFWGIGLRIRVPSGILYSCVEIDRVTLSHFEFLYSGERYRVFFFFVSALLMRRGERITMVVDRESDIERMV